MLWPIPDRVGTPTTAFLISATATLRRNRLYLHNHCADPRRPGLISFCKSMATPLNTFQISSPSNLASIPVVAGSDMENLALKVPILSTLSLDRSGDYTLATWYVHSSHLIAHHHDIYVILRLFCLRRRGILRQMAIWGTCATSNFLGENGGVDDGSCDQGAFIQVHSPRFQLILNAQPVLVSFGQGRRAGYQAIFCHITNGE